jgi:hypothetical protein
MPELGGDRTRACVGEPPPDAEHEAAIEVAAPGRRGRPPDRLAREDRAGPARLEDPEPDEGDRDRRAEEQEQVGVLEQEALADDDRAAQPGPREGRAEHRAHDRR